MGRKVSIGVVGLAFGREFAAIYCDHPDVDKVAICVRSADTLKKVGDELGIPEEYRFSNYDDMVACRELDAIHIVTPIMDHYPQAVKALRAGKHVACTVPMATTVDQLRDIIRTSKEVGKTYMMMETSLYTREFLYVKNMATSGKLGRIQYVQGDHMQNQALDGWGSYWRGFPPFWYGTHVLSPILNLLETTPESVICNGSGRVSPDKAERYGCPYAVEIAVFKMRNSDVVAQAHRCLFETIRQVRECFDIYGDKMSFEWETTVDEGHTIFHGIDDFDKFRAPDTSGLLPPEIRKYTMRENIQDPTQPSFVQGSGHGGSHPHLCHEFVRSIIEERKPAIDAVKSANYTVAGICAQESAFKGGISVQVPDFAEEFR